MVPQDWSQSAHSQAELATNKTHVATWQHIFGCEESVSGGCISCTRLIALTRPMHLTLSACEVHAYDITLSATNRCLPRVITDVNALTLLNLNYRTTPDNPIYPLCVLCGSQLEAAMWHC